MSRKMFSAFAFIFLMLMLLSVADAETIMSPRSKAEHEAEIRALNEKYAPKPDAQLEAHFDQF